MQPWGVGPHFSHCVCVSNAKLIHEPCRQRHTTTGYHCVCRFGCRVFGAGHCVGHYVVLDEVLLQEAMGVRVLWEKLILPRAKRGEESTQLYIKSLSFTLV